MFIQQVRGARVHRAGGEGDGQVPGATAKICACTPINYLEYSIPVVN